MEYTIAWITKKFAKRPEIVNANIAALKAGYNYADITETLPVQYHIKKAALEAGTYRKITGNEATAIGLITAARLAGKTLFYGSYPITPASNILHELAARKHYDVKTFQAEDEISAIGSAIGAAFGGQIAVTGTSGPGMCLKAEALGLAIMAELPLVVVNVQRGGPSTGMPTKTEQADLLQAMYGRNGESPAAVIAPRTPADCFNMALEAVRLAVKFMTPVILLSEGYLANAAEPWKLPEISELPQITVEYAKVSKEPFLPYARNSKTLARPWGIPGAPGLEHRIGGLAKADLTGNVSYDPVNNQKMMQLRAEKIRRISDDIPELEVRGARTGKLLVLGWGGTYGSISQALSDLAKKGIQVSHAHLNYLNPFPKNIEDVIKGFEKILIPELNLGHLLFMMRSQFPQYHFEGFHKVEGQPFQVNELADKIKETV